MRRSTAALILLVLFSLTAAACGGGSTETVTLTSQVQRPGGAWTTERMTTVDCTGSRRLCTSVSYVVRHQPSTPCTQIGTIAPPSRVLVTGRLDSAALDATLHPLCNPSRPLAAAWGAVFRALGG